MRKVLPNCRKCSEPIDPSEKRATGGDTNVCRSCRVVYYKAYNDTRDTSDKKPRTASQVKQKAEYCANYWRLNKSKMDAYHARYRDENRERINARQRAYREKNLEAVKRGKKRRKHVTNTRNKHRYKNDPSYKLRALVRARLYEVISAVKGPVGFTAGQSYRLLGCSLYDLKLRIEGMFRDGMTWDNHAVVWELDHVKPLAAFDLIDERQLAEACHYTNLQPLLCRENNSKSDFYDGVRSRRSTKSPRTVRDTKLAIGHDQEIKDIHTP